VQEALALRREREHAVGQRRLVRSERQHEADALSQDAGRLRLDGELPTVVR
jgi:hypothetical protein